MTHHCPVTRSACAKGCPGNRPCAMLAGVNVRHISAMDEIKEGVARIFAQKPLPAAEAPKGIPNNLETFNAIRKAISGLENAIAEGIESGNMEGHLEHYGFLPPLRKKDYATFVFTVTLPVLDKAHGERLVEKVKKVSHARGRGNG